jgi:Anti-sigma-K factor rskA
VSTQPWNCTHREIQEFLGVYALDAVDRKTATMVELHLEGCIKCSIEVAQHHAVAGLLANSGGASPARLWDAIANQLDGSAVPLWEVLAQRLGSGDGQAEQVEGSEHEQADATDKSHDLELVGATVVPIPAERRPRRMLGRAMSVVAAAAAVVAIAFGVQENHLNHQLSARQTPSLLTQAEQTALNTRSTKEVQLTALRGSHGSSSVGRVTVVLTKSGTGFVEAEGLSSLPNTETYQLWGVIGSQTISLGLLGSDPAIVPFSVAGDMPVEAFAITAEHSGGVVQSSNQPVVAGEVTT